MSYEKERRNHKAIDQIVLKATAKELRKIQKLDYQTQLDGKSFYDNFLEHRETVMLQAKNNRKK